jgi:hypothetical protein
MSNLPSQATTLSLTEWWQALEIALNRLERAHPRISSQSYFMAANEMIIAGKKTEKAWLAGLLANKYALKRAENKFQIKCPLSRPEDDVTVPGCLPKIDSPLALIFALDYYDHLKRYENVVAEGNNAKTLQRGYNGTSTGECIDYYKPFTQNAAALLLQSIRDYMIIDANDDALLALLDGNKEACDDLYRRADLLEELSTDEAAEALSTVDEQDSPETQLLKKISAYLTAQLSTFHENDPLLSLSKLISEISALKVEIDKIITIKALLETLEQHKRQQTPFNTLNATLFNLSPEERQAFQAHQQTLRIEPAPEADIDEPVSISYRLFKALTPVYVSDTVDYYLGWLPTPAQPHTPATDDKDEQSYNWVIALTEKKLERRSALMAAELNARNQTQFLPTDFTRNSKDALKRLSNGLATFDASLTEVEHTIDKYIKKHRIGMASFVDLKPIRLLTHIFNAIPGMSRIINDKYLLFKKARAFKKELVKLKSAINTESMTKQTAKEQLTSLTEKLHASAHHINKESRYFSFYYKGKRHTPFGKLRRENDSASDDLKAIALTTSNLVR